MGGSAESPLVDPNFDYCLADYTVTAVNRAGKRFPFRDGDIGLIDDFNYDGKPTGGTVRGSGVNPRAHVRTIYNPDAMLSMPVDTARRFEKFCGPNGLVTLLFTREKPNSVAITDKASHWKPLFGGISGKSEGSPVKVEGKALRLDKDVKGVLA